MTHPQWTHVDPRADALYIHLHDPDNSILRLAGRAELANGCPELTPGDRMQPISFDPGAAPAEAVLLLRDLLVDQLALRPNDRWMSVSWLLTAFFLDRCSRRALLRITGRAFEGRAAALQLFTALLYGHRDFEQPDVDQLAESAGRNPLVAFDKGLLDFHDHPQACRLLVSLARGAEVKTLAAMVEDRPFDPPEFVRWSFRARCSKHWVTVTQASLPVNPPFDQLIQSRSRILSGLFQLFADQVVPGLEKRRLETMERLGKGFTGHQRCHLDSFLALMIVILRALMGQLYEDPGRAEFETWSQVETWIESQD